MVVRSKTIRIFLLKDMETFKIISTTLTVISTIQQTKAELCY